VREFKLNRITILSIVLSITLLGSTLSTTFLSLAQAVSPTSTRPTVQIASPSYCTVGIRAGQPLLVEGKADSKLGIKKVEYLVHTYPFNGLFSFELTKPAAPNNWSSWSTVLNLTGQGPHRILIMATDNAGNQNWDERVIDVLPESPVSSSANKTQRIAFVEPTFTEGAYNHAFYDFYAKYTPTVPLGKGVTENLNLLNATIPKHLFRGKISGFNVPRDEFHDYLNPIAITVKKFAPNASLFNITDGDIDSGVLFKNGKNMFDVLFLFHNEYVTQTEYTSLKNFVFNGGTIVAMDGNIFYAEVKYNKHNCTIGLVKGHDWDFTDGKTAIKSAHERFFDETKWFIGSNFIVNDISEDVRFANNPFNYRHFEENFVNNKNVLILLDYQASFPVDGSQSTPDVSSPDASSPDGNQPQKKIIATYELKFGRGKVIMLGLFAERLVHNPVFLNFLDKVILPRAVGSKYMLDVNQTSANDIYWKSDLFEVYKIVAQPKVKGLAIYLNNSIDKVPPLVNSNLTITVPKALLGINSEVNPQISVTTGNGTSIPFRAATDDLEIGLKFSVPPKVKDIQISTSNNIPSPTM
jgi:hypothetical protein